MKKSSLITVALASLVALVGCNKQPSGPKEKYPEEKSIVSTCVSTFFGDDVLDYIETGDDAVYLGKDEEGQPVYGPGASFDVIFWDSQDEVTGETTVYSLEKIIGLIGYNYDSETGEYAEPDISGVMEEAELNYNYTSTAWPYAAYIHDEGGEDYLMAPLQIPGYQLEGTYLRVDMETYKILFRLDVELLLFLSVARDNLATYFGDEAAQAISATGYFQEDTINVFGATITCFDPRKL